jgi:hypothetical protein
MYWDLRQRIVELVHYPLRQYNKFQEYRHRRIKDESVPQQIARRSHGDVPLPRGFVFCLSLVATVLLIAVVFIIWAGAVHPIHDGLVVALHEGSCSTAREANFWIHLLINALATVTYAASSYTMQRLTAPTRQDLDAAHKDGDFFRIGSIAIWNLALLSRTKYVIFFLLWASSFPLHLVFNSAIVYTASNAEWSNFAVQASEYQLSSLVSNRTIHSWNMTRGAYGIRSSAVYLDIFNSTKPTAQMMMQQLPQLKELSTRQCIETYASGSNATWGDVVVVTAATDDYTLEIRKRPQNEGVFPMPELGAPWSWMCSGYGTCDANEFKTDGHWSISGRTMSKCLARPMPEMCELNTSLAILTMVIICLTCKLCCITGAVLLSRDRPLLTIGDAIASYMEKRNTIPFKSKPPGTNIHIPSKNSWVLTSRKRIAMVEMPGAFWRTTILGSLGLILAFYLFSYTYRQTTSAYQYFPNPWSFRTMLNMGFDLPLLWNRAVFNGLMTYSDSHSAATSYISGAIITNLAQVGLSAFYLTTNHFYTCFFRGLEFRSYSTHRRGLRVSRTKIGTAQRQAHYLQLPLRYAIPKIMVFILLHTLLSQTLFLRRTYATYPTSFTDPNEIGKTLVSLIGYSPLGALCFASLLAVVVLGTIIVAIIPIDWIWKGTDGNSRIIADNCALPPTMADADSDDEFQRFKTGANTYDLHLFDTNGNADVDTSAQSVPETKKIHRGEAGAQYREVRWGVVRKYVDGSVNCAFSVRPVRRAEIGEKIARIKVPREAEGVQEKAEPSRISRKMHRISGSNIEQEVNDRSKEGTSAPEVRGSC